MHLDPRRALAVVGVLAALLAACGTQGDAAVPDAPDGLVVFAAASLTEAFEALGTAFAATDGGVPVVLNLAGSQTLAAQLVEGAPADVFAAADAVRMAVVAEAGLLAAPAEPFATNHLAIVVEPGNPRGITGPPDLASGELGVVLPAEEGPAGRYARQLLAAAGVTVAPASLEPDVRAAVAKVALGEADATIAYASDVASADGRVDGVAIPDAVDVTATYPIAVLVDAPAGVDVAARFVAFVRSDAGRAILAAHGFGAP
ncbi:MAG: molybdate ABC transporter substrate-binding protein [Nitriliruptoraceae bacterium]